MRELAWQRSTELPGKRFSAEQIIFLLRQIEGLTSQGRRRGGLRGGRRITAELLSLAEGVWPAGLPPRRANQGGYTMIVRIGAGPVPFCQGA
jgi:hypothetical protein